LIWLRSPAGRECLVTRDVKRDQTFYIETEIKPIRLIPRLRPVFCSADRPRPKFWPPNQNLDRNSGLETEPKRVVSTLRPRPIPKFRYRCRSGLEASSSLLATASSDLNKSSNEASHQAHTHTHSRSDAAGIGRPNVTEARLIRIAARAPTIDQTLADRLLQRATMLVVLSTFCKDIAVSVNNDVYIRLSVNGRVSEDVNAITHVRPSFRPVRLL